MFAVYFGQYLTEKGYITLRAYETVMKAMKSVRIKMGFLAVEAGYMTMEQASWMNRLQAQIDMRFGDLAKEHGLLTEEQIQELLQKQGNPYLQFVQTLIERGIMDLDSIYLSLDEFAAENDFDSADMEALKSGELDRICPLFIRELSLPPNWQAYIGIVARTALRLIDRDIKIEKAYRIDEYEAPYIARQDIEGDDIVATAFAGTQEGILGIARQYAQEEFQEVDEDALDAVCEFLNVCNGLYVSHESSTDKELELCVPQMYNETSDQGTVKVTADDLICIPMYLFAKRVDLLLSYSGNAQFRVHTR
ncbi:MAG: hypothetical protein LBM69_00800 [Lachnospiraceae bacterium]|jgi:CheY-specific phosphatase CheX|nr:hypothetical protein [Lachnospiraceae bacterium]